MKPRFEAAFKVDTAAHGLTIKNQILDHLSGKDIFDEVAFKISGLSFQGGWRFNSLLDRNTFRDWVKDQIQTNPQVKDWFLSARLSWHNCRHEEAVPTNCGTESYQEFIK